MYNPFCHSCGGPLLGCGHCGACQPDCGCKNKCAPKCGCPDAISSIEADTTNPTNLRYNFGGKSYWYDFESVVKAGETCTSILADATTRNLIYNAECGRQTISARSLGSILHLADIGDVDETSIDHNSILVYRKDADCGENCEGKNGWIGIDPSEEGDASLDYILGSDNEGDVKSLMPPANNTNQFYYLAWAAQDKASWTQPTVAASAPVDGDGKVWRVYMDPTTKELVIVKENP